MILPDNNNDILLIYADWLEDQGICTKDLREEIENPITNSWHFEYRGGVGVWYFEYRGGVGGSFGSFSGRVGGAFDADVGGFSDAVDGFSDTDGVGGGFGGVSVGGD